MNGGWEIGEKGVKMLKNDLKSRRSKGEIISAKETKIKRGDLSIIIIHNSHIRAKLKFLQFSANRECGTFNKLIKI